MREIISQSWNLFRQKFLLISSIVLAIWLPLEVISSYMDYYVFDPDNLRASYRFSIFIENFIGIIATAAIISVGYKVIQGKNTGFFDSIGTGGLMWSRMFTARFFAGLIIVAGLICLIIPGILISLRLSLIESIAVCEKKYGINAAKRSFELTKGKSGKIFLLFVFFILLFSPFLILTTVFTTMFPEFDNWLINAISNLIYDFLGAYTSICLLVTYFSLSKEQASKIKVFEYAIDNQKNYQNNHEG